MNIERTMTTEELALYLRRDCPCGNRADAMSDFCTACEKTPYCPSLESSAGYEGFHLDMTPEPLGKPVEWLTWLLWAVVALALMFAGVWR